MFDIGFSELLVIALVALVVLGPERLPKAARMAGMWLRRARMQWQAVKSELENELADEDMRRSILRARDELREAQESLRADGARLRAQLADVEARMTEAPPLDTRESSPGDTDAGMGTSFPSEHAPAPTALTAPTAQDDALHASGEPGASQPHTAPATHLRADEQR